MTIFATSMVMAHMVMVIVLFSLWSEKTTMTTTIFAMTMTVANMVMVIAFFFAPLQFLMIKAKVGWREAPFNLNYVC